MQSTLAIRPVPLGPQTPCHQHLGKPHDPMVRAIMTFVAGRDRGKSWNRSGVPNHAQTLESSRARAFHGRMRIFSCDIDARRCVPLEADAFPSRLRPPSPMSRSTASVRITRCPRCLIRDSVCLPNVEGPIFAAEAHRDLCAPKETSIWTFSLAQRWKAPITQYPHRCDSVLFAQEVRPSTNTLSRSKFHRLHQLASSTARPAHLIAILSRRAAATPPGCYRSTIQSQFSRIRLWCH